MEEQLNAGQSQPSLTKKERRELRREEKAREIARTKRTRQSKTFLFFGGMTLLIVGIGAGAFWFLARPSGNLEASVLKTCVTHSGGMHIHPQLKIIVNGESEVIPANTGIRAHCMSPIHTHDSSGTLHVEFQRLYPFTLGNFFTIWKRPFPAGARMTVNGVVSNEYENYVLKDHDQIEIRYEK